MAYVDQHKKEKLQLELEDYQDMKTAAIFENEQRNRAHLRELKYFDYSIEELRQQIRDSE